MPRHKGSRNKTLNPKIDVALDLLAKAAVAGKRPSITDAAKQAGYSRSHLHQALRRGDIQARALSKVRSLIGTVGVMRAGSTLIEMLDAQSENVRLEAATRTLAISGIRPPSDDRPAPSGGVSVTIVYKHLTANIGAPEAQMITERPALTLSKTVVER